MKTLAFFNNKGGVGKTSLVYHLAHMFSQQGRATVVADLDPQANLTAMFMSDEKLETLWEEGETIYTAISPLTKGIGDVKTPKWERHGDNITLIPGDLRLSNYEGELSAAWPGCLTGVERAFRVETAFYRIIQTASNNESAEWALIDIGPNLGAINRAALLACDYIVTPISPDLFSWQGLHNLKPTLNKWRTDWQQCKQKFKEMSDTEKPNFTLPKGDIHALGYVAMRFQIHASKPVKSYQRWLDKMPAEFSKLIDEQQGKEIRVTDDKNCLGILKDYRSLMPMAQENRKPMFNLTGADGAFGSHAFSAQKCRDDFSELAKKIMEKMNSENR